MQPSVHKLEQSRLHYHECMLCEHRCGVNRAGGERGVCKADSVPRLFRHRIEYGEELELIPSHLFYLSGCDLRCAFCIAEDKAFNPRAGRPLEQEFFNAAVQWGTQQGACNLQWVGGEPTIHLPAVLEVMARCPSLPPIVWKSDFHGTPESFALLEGVVDVYVADFKFGNDDCAREIAGIDNYCHIITRNLHTAAAQADLIVRHLLLPGHFDCCYRPIVTWMGEHLPTAKFSIRDGYLPKWRAKTLPGLSKPLSPSAYGEAYDLASKAELCLVH